MPLITPPTAPSGPPSVTTRIWIDGTTYTVGHGSTVIGQTTDGPMFGAWNLESRIVNHGTIWYSNPGWLLNAGYFGQITNTGLIGSQNVGTVICLDIGLGWTGLNNSGQIYALSTEGSATTILYSDSSAIIENSGIIAAQCLNYAVTIYSANGGSIFNSATGQILAESMQATAIVTAGFLPTFAPNPVIENAGLIEARSTDPNQASIGIEVRDPGPRFDMVNSGTIRADWAVYVDDFNSSPVSGGHEYIVNLTGGLIDGSIWLGMQADSLINSGTINGWVGMGHGADIVDTSLGEVNGVVDLGEGDDTFRGSSGFDLVQGGRGNDAISGNDGNDLLVGGRGDDLLTGGAGNDGLYGDFGNDRILTQGGDLVDAGGNNDRVELGDLTFTSVDGGSGFDTLVLPTGARTLDLSAMLAGGRIMGFEAIELNGGKQLIVRPEDIAALTAGGSTLRVNGAAGEILDLVGAWTANGTVNVSGISYQSYVLNGVTVLVSGAVSVNPAAAALPGAGGLDPVASGAAPPAPSSAIGVVLDVSKTITNYFELFDYSLVIEADEHWIAEFNDPLITELFASLDPEVTNWGRLTGNGVVFLGYFGNITNHGTIETSAPLPQVPITEFRQFMPAYFVDAASDTYAIGIWADSGSLANHGAISANSPQTFAIGMFAQRNGSRINTGVLQATSDGYVSIGFLLRGGGSLENSGSIAASAGIGSYGMVISTFAMVIDNSGEITASSSTSGGTGMGVLFSDIYIPSTNIFSPVAPLGPVTNVLTNSGTITAPIAIASAYSDVGVVLLNQGQINGAIRFDAEVRTALGTTGHGADDVIFNSGGITGEVRLGVGFDRYDGTDGTQNGTVLGEAGSDWLTGSNSTDRLEGGDGSDVLYASAGGDMLLGGAGRDSFVFYAANQQGATIGDFASGEDRLDLTALTPISANISGSGNSWTVTVQTASGPLTIAVTGSIAMTDLILSSATQNGTAGEDALVAAAGGSVLNGLDGRDFLIGRDGNDVLDGGTQANDRDLMIGGRGDDTYVVTYNDQVFELFGEGYDTLSITPGFSFYLPENFERMIGGSGYGNALDNIMIGSTTDDVLDGFGGNDRLSGLAGNDTYIVEGQNDLIFENAGEGTDTITSYSSFYLYDNVENLNLYTTGLFDGDDLDLFGVGNALDNVMRGNGGDNLLLAGLGDDTLLGGGGNDALFGEDGNDLLQAGSGIDYVVGGNGNDTIEGNQGADALYGGDGDDIIYGDTGPQGDPYAGAGYVPYIPPEFVTDILVGGAGNDTLYANSGLGDYDLLDGGSGNDTYWVDTGDDLTFEAVGGGIDTVHADVRVANAGVYLYANVENLVLHGTTAFGVGNELDNVLTGSASGNWLLGGLGADTINGGAGNDVLFGEGGADVFVFGANSGADVIGDFAAGTDRIQLNGLFADFASLSANFAQVGADGAIYLPGGNLIVLHGVTMSALTAADFIFAPVAEAPSVADKAPSVMDLPERSLEAPLMVEDPLLRDPAEQGLMRWGSVLHDNGWAFV